MVSEEDSDSSEEYIEESDLNIDEVRVHFLHEMESGNLHSLKCVDNTHATFTKFLSIITEETDDHTRSEEYDAICKVPFGQGIFVSETTYLPSEVAIDYVEFRFITKHIYMKNIPLGPTGPSS